MKTTHTHHKIPRYMGGTDDPDNLVELTVEEHAEAHRKLYEDYGNWQDKIAWHMLSGQITAAEAIKQAQREANLNNKNFLGKTHTAEVRAIISETQKRVKKGNNYRVGKTYTDESKQKISESLKGNSNKKGKTGAKLSDETKQKMSAAKTGDNNVSKRPEVRAKLKEAALKREAAKRAKRLSLNN